MKIAAAPISWGVCEVPGWGVQLSAERVLGDIQALGLTAVEAGPDGFLSSEALGRYGLHLVGGFARTILHDPHRLSAELDALARRARWLASAGAEVLVLAAAAGGDGYDARAELSEQDWACLFAALKSVEAMAHRLHLAVAVHPHVGTVIEGRAQVDRFLEGCATGLCLDTGHLVLGGTDPAGVVARAAGRIHHVHLKDVDRGVAERVRARALAYHEAVRQGLYRPLGEGDAGIAEVVRSLREAGYAGWYVLEQDAVLTAEPGAGAPPLSAVRKSVEFIRGALR